MEEKQEDRSKQAHIKHTKDKVFNIVLRRTKGKNCQQFVQCDPCCHTLQQPQKWVGVGVLSSIWPQDLIYTTTELRTQTLLGMDLEPSDRFWTYIQYIETGARREEEGIGEVGKKDLFFVSEKLSGWPPFCQWVVCYVQKSFLPPNSFYTGGKNRPEGWIRHEAKLLAARRTTQCANQDCF